MSLECKLWAGGEAGPVGSLHMGEFQALSQRMGGAKGVTSSVVFCPAPVPHMHHQPPSFHYWRFLFYYFVFFWLRSKINLQDLQGTCTKKAAWAAWQYGTKTRALGSQGLTWNLWIKNLNAVSCGRWMDVVSEMPAWFWLFQRHLRSFAQTPQIWKQCVLPCCLLERSPVDVVLWAAQVWSAARFWKPHKLEKVLMKCWSWWWSVWDWPLQVG